MTWDKSLSNAHKHLTVIFLFVFNSESDSDACTESHDERVSKGGWCSSFARAWRGRWQQEGDHLVNFKVLGVTYKSRQKYNECSKNLIASGKDVPAHLEIEPNN